MIRFLREFSTARVTDRIEGNGDKLCKFGDLVPGKKIRVMWLSPLFAVLTQSSLAGGYSGPSLRPERFDRTDPNWEPSQYSKVPVSRAGSGSSIYSVALATSLGARQAEGQVQISFPAHAGCREYLHQMSMLSNRCKMDQGMCLWNLRPTQKRSLSSFWQ